MFRFHNILLVVISSKSAIQREKLNKCGYWEFSFHHVNVYVKRFKRLRQAFFSVFLHQVFLAVKKNQPIKILNVIPYLALVYFFPPQWADGYFSPAKKMFALVCAKAPSTLRKFENAGLFIYLGLPPTLTELVKTFFKPEENILKTDLPRFSNITES